jgi:hypothetical protein
LLKEDRMSKQMLTVVVLALAAAGGWALAQQSRPPSSFPRPDEPAPVQQSGAPAVPQPGLGGKLPPAAGRYHVALSGERGVLVDSATGKTWDLVRGNNGRAVWLPARKLDSDKDIRQWLDSEKDRGAALRERERALEREAALLQAEQEAQQRQAAERTQQALRALEEARRRLAELEQRRAPDKDKK